MRSSSSGGRRGGVAVIGGWACLLREFRLSRKVRRAISKKWVAALVVRPSRRYQEWEISGKGSKRFKRLLYSTGLIVPGMCYSRPPTQFYDF